MRALTLLLLGFLVNAAAADGVTLPDAERVELANGTVLILVENHEVPLIGLEAVIVGGAAADPTTKHGLAGLYAALLSQGAGERDAASFVETAAAVGGEIGASAGVESIVVAAEFMSRDAALMVELVADMLIRPALNEPEFEKLRERSVNFVLAAKGNDPSGLMSSYANAFLFAEHPYGNPVSGSESSLANIQYEDVLAYHTDRVGGDRLVIAVSGDFETAAMREILTAAFGEWRAASGALAEIPVATPSSGRRVLLIDKPGATQTYFYIGNVGVARGYAARAELDLANTVFGGRFTSMLMTELRTKSGLSYSARSSLARYSRPGSVFIASSTETDTTFEAIDLALVTLARFRDNGLDAAMIQSARNYIMGQFPTRLETAAQLASTFALLESTGLDVSYINGYGPNLAAATRETIAATINEVYPQDEDLVFIVLGDAETLRESIAKYGAVTEMAISETRFHP